MIPFKIRTLIGKKFVQAHKKPLTEWNLPPKLSDGKFYRKIYTNLKLNIYGYLKEEKVKSVNPHYVYVYEIVIPGKDSLSGKDEIFAWYEM